MIAALDSSSSRPTPARARQAYAAGVRAWGGYLGSRPGLGLATLWSREDFKVIQDAGMTAIGFCSGWDSPEWIRQTAEQWGILACVDVEPHIREDHQGGVNWVPDFLQRAQCGLYGSMSVHYETGEASGRGATFNIMAWYLGYDPRATWYDAIEARPVTPCGWQWWGTHDEFGCTVDRSWLDDLIVPSGSGRGGDLEEAMASGDALTLDGVTVICVPLKDGSVGLASSTGGLGGLQGGSFLSVGTFTTDTREVWLGWDTGPSADGANQVKRVLVFLKDGEGSVYGQAFPEFQWDKGTGWALVAGLQKAARAAVYQELLDTVPQGPEGPPGPPGATASQIADEIGKRISNG